MKRIIRLAALFAAAAAAILGSGCTARVAGVANPAIQITYSSAFAGQTAAGSLKLVVDITIANKGYGPFPTTSEGFSVRVNDYSYPCVESSLPAVGLPDGETVRGELTFHVPPAAATPRVGYRIDHAEEKRRNIQWVKQVSSPAGKPVADPEVLITHTGTYMWVNQTRSLYLLLNMTIENRGYESFHTAPERFSLVMGHIFGDSGPRPPILFDGALSEQRDGAYSDLRSYDLQSGGKLSGRLAFQVPVDILLSTESYRLTYAGVRAYNIRWVMKPRSE